MELLNSVLKFNDYRHDTKINRALVNYLINSRYEKKIDQIYQLTFDESTESFDQFKKDLFEAVDRLDEIKENFSKKIDIHEVKFIHYSSGVIVLEFNINGNIKRYIKIFMDNYRFRYLKFICNVPLYISTYLPIFRKEGYKNKSKIELTYFWSEFFKIAILFYAFIKFNNNQQLSVDPAQFNQYVDSKTAIFEMFGSPINSFALNRLVNDQYNKSYIITSKYEDLYPCYCSIDPANPFSIGDAKQLLKHLEGKTFDNLVIMCNPPYTEIALKLGFSELKKIYASTKINYNTLTVIYTAPYWEEEDHTTGIFKPVHKFFKDGTFERKEFYYFDSYNLQYIKSEKHETAQWIMKKTK